MAQTDILEYIRKTPYNSNVNVIKSMLENNGGENNDWSTATVKLNYFNIDLTPVTNLNFNSMQLIISNDQDIAGIELTCAADGSSFSLDELGTINLINIPIYKHYKTELFALSFTDSRNDYYALDTELSSVVNGSAEINNYRLFISGDCELNIVLRYDD